MILAVGCQEICQASFLTDSDTIAPGINKGHILNCCLVATAECCDLNNLKLCSVIEQWVAMQPQLQKVLHKDGKVLLPGIMVTSRVVE
jgi:hypothetical protein